MPRLLHLSDTHLSAPGAPSAHPEIDAAGRLRAVLEGTAPHGPYDAIVVTGDVCDDGSIEGARAVHGMLGHLARVVLAVPGNHDTTAAVEQVFRPPSAQVGAWTVIGASTNVPGQVAGDARPLATALAHLDALAPDRPAVLLHHHPVHSPSAHEWFTLAHREEVLAALDRRTAPLLMLSGHTHEAYDEQVGPVRFVGAPATYYGLRHDADRWTHEPSTTGAVVLDLADDGQVDARVITG